MVRMPQVYEQIYCLLFLMGVVTMSCFFLLAYHTVDVPKLCTSTCLIKWHMRIVQTQIRLLLKEQSDQDLHYLPFHQLICGTTK